MIEEKSTVSYVRVWRLCISALAALWLSLYYLSITSLSVLYLNDIWTQVASCDQSTINACRQSGHDAGEGYSVLCTRKTRWSTRSRATNKIVGDVSIYAIITYYADAAVTALRHSKLRVTSQLRYTLSGSPRTP